MIKVNLKKTYLTNIFNNQSLIEQIQQIHTNKIINKKGLGNDFLGWVKWPENLTSSYLKELNNFANIFKTKNKLDVLVVMGIGGSFLGLKAAYEALKNNFQTEKIKVCFLGKDLSNSYFNEQLDKFKNKSIGVCCISKSGTTLETSVSFNLIMQYLNKFYSQKEIQNRLFFITSKATGVLSKLAKIYQFKTFDIPDDIGGRYSVLTPVGLLPLAILGFNIFKIVEGARQAVQDTDVLDLTKNSAYQYALARFLLFKGQNILNNKFLVESNITFEPSFNIWQEWWKQLFGESEGKENKGLLPISSVFTTDLHSLGQYYQEGVKGLIFETFMRFKINSKINFKVISSPNNEQKLDYLKDYNLDQLNEVAFDSVVKAHYQAQNPIIILECKELSEHFFGYLVYWMMRACAMSAYLLNVNPFDQPGVNIYKKNIKNVLKNKF